MKKIDWGVLDEEAQYMTIEEACKFIFSEVIIKVNEVIDHINKEKE